MDKESNMGTTHTVDNAAHKRPGILYPVMLIAAIVLIVFSVLGIATMLGWVPSAMSGGDGAVKPAAGPAQPSAQSSAQYSEPSARAAVERPRWFASAPAPCTHCGVVESIRVVETEGQGSGLGAIGGAVVGGVLGHQVGSGRGRDVATVVGAGAGAYAGHEIEKKVKKSAYYQVRVRMNDGTYRNFREGSQPALSVGQKVRVTEQGVVALG
jgi:outer membrane lipoprotein SlyB